LPTPFSQSPVSHRKLHGQHVHDLDYMLTRWGLAPGSKTKTKERTSKQLSSLPPPDP